MGTAALSAGARAVAAGATTDPTRAPTDGISPELVVDETGPVALAVGLPTMPEGRLPSAPRRPVASEAAFVAGFDAVATALVGAVVLARGTRPFTDFTAPVALFASVPTRPVGTRLLTVGTSPPTVSYTHLDVYKRQALFSPPSYFARFLEAALAADLDPEGRASWNVGPQRSLFAVAEHEEARVLDRYRWGLVPSWAKDPSIGNKLFNARGETVAEKPSFRTAFAKRPCVIPVDGFYEWDHRPGNDRQPYFFTRRDEQPLLFAGLFENWWNREDEAAPPLATCTIITTTPNQDVDGIHDRMPVILSCLLYTSRCV